MLITRIRPSIYLATCMCAWAVVSAMTAMAKNYIGLLLCRFVLGFVRALFGLLFRAELMG